MIHHLFSQFAVFYGHLWRSQFKDEAFLIFAKQTWQEALAEFSEASLQKAIVYCRNHCELPPTLPQVVHYCRQSQRSYQPLVVDCSDWQPVQREMGTDYLAQWRALLDS